MMMTKTRTLVLAIGFGLLLLAVLLALFGGSVWDELGHDAARLVE